eukprot:gene3841-4785_t
MPFIQSDIIDSINNGVDPSSLIESEQQHTQQPVKSNFEIKKESNKLLMAAIQEESADPSLVIHEDDREIPMIANILLNISANGINTSTSSSPQLSSTIVPSLSENSSPVLASKLKDSSNLVPFTLGDSQSGILQSSGSTDFNGSSLSASQKKKRQRTSPEQLAILEQIFETDKMPSQQIRVRLANQLGMSSRRVQIWFQNKRAKVKRGGPFTRGSGEDGDDSFAQDDEDLDEDDTIEGDSLTIDDSNPTTTTTPTSSSPLTVSSDNLVPSISPILNSVNGGNNQNGAYPSNFNFSFNGFYNNNTNKSSSQPPSPVFINPSSTKKQKTSRPSSPTAFNLSPINNSPLSASSNNIPPPCSPLSASSSTLPSISMIKLNSSSKYIPNNNTTFSSQTPSAYQNDFSVRFHL